MANQTISQRRAAFALSKVQAKVGRPDDEVKKYKTVANAIPSYIQRNGIGQAMAFALSKKEREVGWHWAYECLQEWLRQEFRAQLSKPTLIEGLTSCDMQTYRLAQAEALAMLVWLRKFARAMLTVQE
ncbi:MAG: type III-B CRISPR module-associated protein Cmr5 [Corallincola sp.]|nr:type III-B CRISPR module-associated protein Cmr5 [Corallincola sp.]